MRQDRYQPTAQKERHAAPCVEQCSIARHPLYRFVRSHICAFSLPCRPRSALAGIPIPAKIDDICTSFPPHQRSITNHIAPIHISMASDERPWHEAFPAPQETAPVFPRERAMMILSMKIASLLIIDVRRTDYEGGCIRGSLNIPAQGFWWNRGMLYVSLVDL